MRIHYFLLALALSASAKAAVPDAVVRHDFENITGPSAGGGVVFSGGGNISHTNGILSGGGMQLSESSFGLPASAYVTPGADFAKQVLFDTGLNGAQAVYKQLYPDGYKQGGVDGSRAQIQSGNSAFRYKWLMFGQDPGGTPAIINLFEQTFGNTDDANNPWFNDNDNDNDRAKARAQIEVLREGLAYSPLDTQMQSALLDVYYDLAVAEMQFVRKRQAKLATLRLGLTLDPLKPFIIDQEIDTYTALVEKTDAILADYGNLLSFEMEGFELGDLDPAAGGAPFGYWLFQRRVPGRSQVETDLATAKGPGIIRGIDRVATVILPGANNDFTITGDASVPDNEADFLVMFSEVETLALPSYDSATKTLTIPIITDTTTVNDVIGVESLLQFTLANSESNNGTGIMSVKEDIGALNDPEDADPATPVFAGYKDYRTLLTILGQNIQFRADLARLLGMRQATGDFTMARQLVSKIQFLDVSAVVPMPPVSTTSSLQ